jgi:hypothetical protein
MYTGMNLRAIVALRIAAWSERKKDTKNRTNQLGTNWKYQLYALPKDNMILLGKSAKIIRGDFDHKLSTELQVIS